MTLLLTLTATFSFIALFFVFALFRNLRRRRVVRASGSLAGGVTCASLGGAGMLIVISYTGYNQLIDEQEVAQIEFSQYEQDSYTARLMIDGERDRLLTVSGDEWQIDARVVTWKPPATVLGLDPIYKLERLSGRYTDIERERSEPRTVHALFDGESIDVWTVARSYPKLMPGIDAYYGTATYVPMADGARYAITLSRDALIARPINDIARDAVGQWQQDGT